jgi:hypothetical protein
MDAVKVHILATVLATQATALLKGSAPYFPIEISLTASSGPEASIVFALGLASTLVTVYLAKAVNWFTLAVCAGLVLVAVPDTGRPLALVVHLGGVAVVWVSAMARLYVLRDWTSLPVAIAAVGVFAVRLVFKVCVLLAYDPAVRASIRTPVWLIPFDGPLRALVMQRAIDIMHRGAAAFGKSPEQQLAWQAIAPVFKVCGVLQWVAFYALSCVV